MTDTLYLLTAFDGTGNNRYNDDLDGTTTNVGSIATLFDNEDLNRIALYEKGVGTRDITDEETREAIYNGDVDKADFYASDELAVGIDLNFEDDSISLRDQVDKMLARFDTQLTNNADKNIVLDSIGFSRGAAANRAFINVVNELYADEITSGLLVIRNVVLMDSVASHGAANSINLGFNLNLNEDSAQNIISLEVGDETRANFRLESLRDADGNLPNNVSVFTLAGVHSDIGNGGVVDWFSAKAAA